MAFLVAWRAKGELPTPDAIDPALFEEPRQERVELEEFSFVYSGRTCRVRPVARWEQWGVVVSHNDIESIADLVHDSSSVDTKDLCLVWGENLETGRYLDVEYWSGQFTCYFRYPGGVRFDGRELGNDHLITDRDDLRRRLETVRVGDQVRLSGLLVDYQMDDWEGFWRRTSTTRDDTGCEVVFFEELEVLRRATPGWYRLFDFSRRALVALPLLWLMLFWWEARNPETSRVGRI